jgi:hypothetical protein
MRFREICETASAGATSAGSVAAVATPLGAVNTRNGGSMLSGKYTTDPTPNTPKEYKRNKDARRQFKNSPGK